ncbi:MAG: class I SAM-dependent methyltransferase [Phycisphaeraceae bacterium]|nr:class I SAM-dependent methyltransferase [Phycisphaeraceae bacterium]
MALRKLPKTSRSVRLATRSLDVPAEGAHLIQEFFRPLHALGSMPEFTARRLKRAGLGPESRVLDLGCGKGAVAVEIARRIGCRVLGVDAFAPFIADCRDLARARGVENLCEFRVGVAERIRLRGFDAVVLLNVFPFEQAIRIARRLTKPGGWYIFDDAVALKRRRDTAHLPTPADVERTIEDADDRVLDSKVWSGAEVRSRERAIYKLLRTNAGRVITNGAADRALLEECLRRKLAAISELSGSVRPGWWLARRGRR